MSTIVEALQGSREWSHHRRAHYNASDAGAMLGISPYKSRSALLREKKTGLSPDIDAATQARFDKGHEFEAAARPWAEEILSEELYPIVLKDEVEGLPLSASLDGLTIDDSTSWEHKQLNKELSKALDDGVIPEKYHPQMEQGFLLSGATRCLFMASDGDRDSMRYAWYASNQKMRRRVIDGWKQFQLDLDGYIPASPDSQSVGQAPEMLPALRIEVSGSVTNSNLDDYRDHAIAVFEGISTDLQTDQDFLNAEEAVKFCKQVEQKLSAAKDHALSQTADIDRLFKTIDEISEQARKKRLELDKLVKSMKDERKREIKQAAEADFEKHIGELERELENLAPWPAQIGVHARCDVAGAMKGKRTLATLRDAAETAVANAKIEADRIAREIRANLDVLKTEADGFETLFPDGGQLAVLKTEDDLRNTIKTRIAEHEQRENERAQQKSEADRRQREQCQRHQVEESRRRAAGKCDGNHGGPACDDPECWNDEPATVTRAKNMARKVTVTPERPSDDQIIECVADAFNVDHTTARDWIAGMDMIGAEA